MLEQTVLQYQQEVTPVASALAMYEVLQQMATLKARVAPLLAQLLPGYAVADCLALLDSATVTAAENYNEGSYLLDWWEIIATTAELA